MVSLEVEESLSAMLLNLVKGILACCPGTRVLHSFGKQLPFHFQVDKMSLEHFMVVETNHEQQNSITMGSCQKNTKVS